MYNNSEYNVHLLLYIVIYKISFRNKVLDISDGIDQMGPVKWDLVLCLLLAWIVVYLCICKGIRSSGKVNVFFI